MKLLTYANPGPYSAGAQKILPATQARRQDRRRDRRWRAAAVATIHSGQQGSPCRISDVSENGVRVSCEDQIDGRVVFLIIPGLVTRVGVVAWRDAGDLGISFYEPLDANALSVILQTGARLESQPRA